MSWALYWGRAGGGQPRLLKYKSLFCSGKYNIEGAGQSTKVVGKRYVLHKASQSKHKLTVKGNRFIQLNKPKHFDKTY